MIRETSSGQVPRLQEADEDAPLRWPIPMALLATLIGGAVLSVHFFAKQHTRPQIAPNVEPESQTDTRPYIPYRSPVWSHSLGEGTEERKVELAIKQSPPAGMPAVESNEVMTNRRLEELQKSGDASGSWTSHAWSVISDWKREAKQPVTFDGFRCFSLGCSARATYPSASAFSQANRDLEASTAWTGARYHSGPIADEGGTVEAVWILYRPPSE